MSDPQTDPRIKAIGELFVQLSDEEQRIAKGLYQLLATGRPVELQALSRQCGVPLTMIVDRLDAWPGVYFNDDGAIVGFWGLTVNAVSTHKIIVDDTTVYGWCAWDTLFIPIVLGKTCQVFTSCKQTGEPIQLEVSPTGVETVFPKTVHLSFVLPDEAAFDHDVITSFCCYVHFFRDRDTAVAWAQTQDGDFVLDLKDAVRAAQHKIRFEFQLPLAS
jgi:alkylmercury lyase